MTATDDLVSANARYAETFTGPPEGRPSKHLAVVTCMDTRLDPLEALGLAVGEAHVMRNAGGLVTDDVLRSLAISQRALGTTAIAVLHHTKCGMQGFDDAQFRATCTAEAGDGAAAPTWDVPGFEDPAAQAGASLTALRGCGYLLHRDDIRAFVWDIDSGRVTEVG